MASSGLVIYPGALERILQGPQSMAQKRWQGERVAETWRSNIHRISGATERSIAVEESGTEVVVSADTTRDPESAWVFLEYGTSEMRAQAPGRRAIR